MPWPTSKNPKTDHVTLRLTANEAADLSAAASSAGMSKSAYVRQCVSRVLDHDARKAARLREGAP